MQLLTYLSKSKKRPILTLVIYSTSCRSALPYKYLFRRIFRCLAAFCRSNILNTSLQCCIFFCIFEMQYCMYLRRPHIVFHRGYCSFNKHIQILTNCFSLDLPLEKQMFIKCYLCVWIKLSKETFTASTCNSLPLSLICFCLLGVYRLNRKLFTHMETSPLPMNGCAFWPILGTHGHWAVRVLSVPHRLWHGASV